jgi:hypothetical protein
MEKNNCDANIPFGASYPHETNGYSFSLENYTKTMTNELYVTHGDNNGTNFQHNIL